MTLATFNEMLNICNNYDPFTQYIDTYTQSKQAIAGNERLNKRFNALMETAGWKGYSRGVPMTGNLKTLEKKLREWVWGMDWTIDDDDIDEIEDGVHGVFRTYNGVTEFIPLFED